MRILDEKIKKCTNLPIIDCKFKQRSEYVYVRLDTPLTGFDEIDFEKILNCAETQNIIKKHNAIGIAKDKSYLQKCTIPLFAEEGEELEENNFLDKIQLIDKETGKPYFKLGCSIIQKQLVICLVKD